MNSFTGIVEHLQLASSVDKTFQTKKSNPGINSDDNFNNIDGKKVHEIKNKERSLLPK